MKKKSPAFHELVTGQLHSKSLGRSFTLGTDEREEVTSFEPTPVCDNRNFKDFNTKTAVFRHVTPCSIITTLLPPSLGYTKKVTISSEKPESTKFNGVFKTT